MSESIDLPTRIWREALSEVDRLLMATAPERARSLAELAATRQSVHALVVSLLDAQSRASSASFMEPMRDPPALLAPGAMLGAWRLVKNIGSGGMGEVWLAHRADGLYEGEVAIKTLHPWLARSSMRERFLREAQLLGRISHPHIARLLDAGAAESGLYLVLEYVRGKPLNDYCDDARLTVEKRLHCFVDVCAAVTHAHSHLIVHRDLKPSNILVNDRDEVKLLDFGVATLLDAESSLTDLTRLTGRAFTLEYAAPEQLRGETITTATDVYSLGVLLYQLLTGRLPFTARTNATALEHAVLHEDAVRASRVVEFGDRAAELAACRGASIARLQRELAGDLDNILVRALEKEPERRYPSVADFAADVVRHLRHVPVQARAATVGYRARKFLRRNRLTAGVATLALVAVLAGAGVAWWQARVARTEAAKAVAIRDFLVGIFERNGVSHPDGASARETTAKELLEQGAAEIRTRLKDQPEARAELLDVMAGLYASLDLQREALPLHEERLAHQRILHGTRSIAVARVLSDMAYSHVQIGDYRAARRIATTARDVFVSLGDDRTLEHALALGSLAQVAYRMGDRGADYVEENYAAALQMIERYHPASRWRVEMMLGLERALSLKGRFDQALALCDRALALIESGEVESNGLVRGSVLQTRGTALTWLARHDEAERSVRDAIVEFDSAAGRDHPFAADARRELGTLLMWTGRRAEAMPLLTEALESLERVKGADDPELTAYVRNILASTLILRGSLAKAEPQLRMALAAWLDTPAALLGAKLGLARLLTQQGRFEETATILAGAEAEAVRIFGEQSWMHGTALWRLGDLALARGWLTEARGHYSRLWEEWQEPDDHLTTNRAAGGVGLASVMLAAGDAESAEALTRQVLVAIKRSRSRRDMPDEDAAARQLLAQALLAQGHVAEARTAAGDAVSARERMDAPESLWLADARLTLAEAALRSGDRPSARVLVTLARRAHAVQPHVGPQYAARLAATERLLRSAGRRSPTPATTQSVGR